MADDPKIIAWRKKEADDAEAEKKDRTSLESVMEKLEAGQPITRPEFYRLLMPIVRQHYGIESRKPIAIAPEAR